MHRTIARNSQYRRGGLSIRQRHNERQNMDYMNDDIIKERSEYNVHFKHPTGSYEQMFDAMVADKTISTRGLGKDPFIVDELVFDVNTAYFEERGGYEYAKAFFAEAYRCAVEEIGGEQYVLSAVMHADERNKALSEQLGYDVFHYHLHVSYVPVVEKKVYFRKNNKDPELAGKLREVINQVSHSKKWPKQKQLDENGEIVRNAKGKAVLVNAYSLLQDHFCDHMREAGFDGFERGERGSTAEHLSVLEFKAKKETEKANAEAERAAEAAAIAEQKQQAAAELSNEIEELERTADSIDEQIEKKETRLDRLDGQIAVKQKVKLTADEIEGMGKLTVLGNFSVTADELTKLKTMAKKSLTADERVKDAVRKRKEADEKRVAAESKVRMFEAKEAEAKRAKPSITEHLNWFDRFIAAMRRAPKRLMAVIEDIMRKPPERESKEYNAPAQEREIQNRQHSRGMEL